MLWAHLFGARVLFQALGARRAFWSFDGLFFGKAIAVDHVVNGPKANLEAFGGAAAVALACFESVDEAGPCQGLDAFDAAVLIGGFG